MDIAVAVPPSRAEELFSAVVPLQAAFARRNIRNARLAYGVALVCLAGMLTSVVAIASLLPLQKTVPVFCYLTSDGVMDTTQMISDLPPSLQVAGVEAELWQYGRHREHYTQNLADDQNSYEIVSGMSTQQVRSQFQSWANASNPDSPAAQLKTFGYINVNRISGSFETHSADYTSGTYLLRLCRIVSRTGRPEDQVYQRTMATIGYQMVNRIPNWQRLTYNWAGIIVTSYYIEPEGGFVSPAGGKPPCS